MTYWLEAWSSKEGTARVLALYVDTFGEEPNMVWSAPGRVNLIGEHTDYNGGLALPIAIPFRTYAAISARTDRTVRLISAQEEGVRTVSLDEVGTFDSPDRVDGWPAYVVGVAWAMERETGATVPGFDLAIDSCVPFGAGLSSSAALETAVVGALMDFAGITASEEEQVRWCIQAENLIAGAKTGGMDQSAALRCRKGFALALNCDDFTGQQVPFAPEDSGASLLVVDTRAPHALVDGQYAQRRAACEEAASILGVDQLADIRDLDAALVKLPSDVLKRRVRHVVTEIERTHEAIDVLRAGNYSALGPLFVASHMSLRDDYEVTCPELDLVVDEAMAAGAIGARMTGGGFGGSAIALVPTDKVDEVADQIDAAFAHRGFAQPHFMMSPASFEPTRER